VPKTLRAVEIGGKMQEAALKGYVHSLGFFIFPVPEVPITQG
jgi:hypothetical protein